MARAVELAANPDGMRALKAKLAQNLTTTSLYDAKLYATRLEAAFTAMHARRMRSGRPTTSTYPPNRRENYGAATIIVNHCAISAGFSPPSISTLTS